MEYVRGQKVMVIVPAEERKAFAPQSQYNGQEMVVAKRVRIKRTDKVYYELIGAESRYGIPYAFIREWLMQI